MTEKAWRLLLTGAASAVENMAIDEAVLRCMGPGQPCTLRLYEWQPSAVSIGYFQGLDQEVDIDACRAKGVNVVRRLTGGGAVYHDHLGELTYSLIVPESYPGIPHKVLDSYAVLCAGVVKGLEKLGLPAVFKPINDILVNGKKISGNAQTRRFGGILQHGTILYTVDPTLMFSLLKVPNEKMRDKLIAGVEERVTSILREMGPVDKDTIVQALIAGFSEALNIAPVPGELREDELTLAIQLRTERYGDMGWTHKR